MSSLRSRIHFSLLCTFAALVSAPLLQSQEQSSHHPVLMISVDAMNPHYVLAAGSHAAAIPFLESLLRDGSYAQSVINVVPTITNPNHVTLITGTEPARHGIFNNMLQDPISNSKAAPMEYGNAIRVETLWQAAHAAGITTASVFWPVTLGATGVDYNIPPIHTQQTPADHYLLEAVSRPDGYLAALEKEIGLYSSTSDDEDGFATRAALAIIRDKRPGFLTVHLSGLDEAQHQNGPDSPEAYAALTTLDAELRQLVQAERAVYPEANIVVVSDHGFFPVRHVINLNAEFARAGLLTLAEEPTVHIASWKAFSWTGGGSAVVMLHDPDDRKTEAAVSALLKKLQKDPANGIARVLSREEALPLGGTPQTAFLIDCMPGYYVGRNLKTPLITDAAQKGTHGYLPSHPELQSSFFIEGPSISRGKNLGIIDMRQIAPTVAAELGIKLPQAAQPPLLIR